MQAQRYNVFSFPHLVSAKDSVFEVKKTGFDLADLNKKRVEYLVEKGSQLRLTRNTNLKEKVSKFMICSDAEILARDENSLKVAQKNESKNANEMLVTGSPVSVSLPPLDEHAGSYTLSDADEKEENLNRDSMEVEESSECSSVADKLSRSTDEEDTQANLQRGRYFSQGNSVQKCYFCRKLGHVKADCPENKPFCHYCLSSHLKAECKLGMTCLNCGSIDHIRSLCPCSQRACARCNRVHKSRVCVFVTMNRRALEEDSHTVPRDVRCMFCGQRGHANCYTTSYQETEGNSPDDRLFSRNFKRQLNIDAHSRHALNQYLHSIRTNAIEMQLATKSGMLKKRSELCSPPKAPKGNAKHDSAGRKNCGEYCYADRESSYRKKERAEDGRHDKRSRSFHREKAHQSHARQKDFPRRKHYS